MSGVLVCVVPQLVCAKKEIWSGGESNNFPRRQMESLWKFYLHTYKCM